MKEIVFITDKNHPCQKCKGMKNALELIKEMFGGEVVIRELHWEERESIELGDKYDMMELPACLIGDRPFCGDSWTFDELVDATKEIQRN